MAGQAKLVDFRRRIHDVRCRAVAAGRPRLVGDMRIGRAVAAGAAHVGVGVGGGEGFRLEVEMADHAAAVVRARGLTGLGVVVIEQQGSIVLRRGRLVLLRGWSVHDGRGFFGARPFESHDEHNHRRHDEECNEASHGIPVVGWLGPPFLPGGMPTSAWACP